jgi:DNA-binding NarL/FixJ family response regulator
MAPAGRRTTKSNRRQTKAAKSKPNRIAPAESRINLVLVDDHPLWRATLRQIVEHRKVGRVIAEASDGDEALKVVKASPPDVVVMDMNLPKVDGVETTRLIVGDNPEVKVMVLASSDESADVIAAVRAGASGYLLKTASGDEVANAIVRIHRGELVFPPELANVVLAEVRGGAGIIRRDIRIVVGDDSTLSRQGLESVLAGAGFSVVGGSALDDITATVQSVTADVAVVDLGQRSFDAAVSYIESIRASHPDLGLVVLLNALRASHINRLASEGSRPIGYLLKHRVVDAEHLADAVERIAKREAVIDPEVASHMVNDQETKTRLGGLTKREQEVLSLMAQGRSNQAICEQLFLSPKSVEAYVGSIFSKLGLAQAPDDHRRVLAVLAHLESGERTEN